jgi:lipid-A-disaccharide synthase-like uncharacterized protein
MDWLTDLVFHDGKFLGITWDMWKGVGWAGNLLFASRFFVQWWATEKHRRVVVPSAFWWLSLVGSGCLLAYGLHRRDSVFIFAYVFTWIPYIRNLIIGARTRRHQSTCPSCGAIGGSDGSGAAPNFCAACGVKLMVEGMVTDRSHPSPRPSPR